MGGNTMKLNPLSNRVVIRFEEAEEKTKTGIILTASAQEKPQIAEVVAVGPGKITDNATANGNDSILSCHTEFKH